MVPSNRLIFWTAMIGVPFTLFGTTLAATRPVALAALGSFGALAVGDAFAARGRLRGIGIQLPETVRLQKDRESEIELRILNEGQRAATVRIGLPLPPEIQSASEDLHVTLPSGSAVSRVNWACVPRKRGRFVIDRCHVETASWLGFWDVRAQVSLRSELRVYPNLMDERTNVAALFLARGRQGIRVQRHSGKGRDFEKLREYVPGDSFDDIHWRASAKRGHPVTKVFQIERTQEVYVIIDASRLSGRLAPAAGPAQAADAAERTALERFMTAGLILGLAAEQQGDLFGLLTFSDRVERFVRARSGKAHYDACRDALYILQPQLVTPNFEELASFIRTRMRRRSLLVVLTALDDPVLAESFVKSIDLVSRQHLVLVNMLQPVGAAPLFSDAEVQSSDDIFERLGGHLLWHDLRELGKVLQRRGVTFRLLSKESLTADLVSQYLDVKGRQLL
jgi:uncharacterized protein (DUF58 family)